MRIQEFLTYLEKQKKFSKHTIKAYSIDLNQFERELARVCEGDTSDESIDTNIIRVWIMDLSEQGVSNRSINRKITALRSYFHYLEKIDEDIVNPMSKIIAPKIPKRKMSFISKEDMQSILNEEYDEKDFISVRNHLIIEILYSTGIRRSELIGLKEKDISYSDFCFKVLGKRRKERKNRREARGRDHGEERRKRERKKEEKSGREERKKKWVGPEKEKKISHGLDPLTKSGPKPMLVQNC